MTNPQHPPVPKYICRIQAEKLFGQFDHDLCFGEPAPDNPNLLILYGENGTGKTTLLWLVYHLLNKRMKEGHRTYLTQHRFKRLSVAFNDETEVSAERDSARLGDFKMNLTLKSKVAATYNYQAGKDGKIKDLSDDKSHFKFTESLPSFDFGFLPHDRLTKVGSDALSLRLRVMAHEGLVPSSEQVSPIQASISKAIGTARQKAIRASNQGQFTVNAIYTELIQRIAQVHPTLPESSVEEGRRNVLLRLERQAALTRQYSEFGLISELQVKGLLHTLRTIPPDRLDIVTQVLEPFLRGNEARLDALEPLHIALTALVETVNSLYLNKRITLHLEKGLQISTLTGEQLMLHQLSSGEQELLILNRAVLRDSARERDRLFATLVTLPPLFHSLARITR